LPVNLCSSRASPALHPRSDFALLYLPSLTPQGRKSYWSLCRCWNSDLTGKMLTAMSWPAPKGAALPAIQIRPRPPPAANRPSNSPVSNNDLESSSTVPETQSVQRPVTAEQSLPATTATLDLPGQGEQGHANPAKRARASSPQTQQGRQKKLHQCSTCQHTFARAEHLIRHERSRTFRHSRAYHINGLHLLTMTHRS